MSYLQVLNDVYKKNRHLIGKVEKKVIGHDKSGQPIFKEYQLMPILHKAQKATIEILLDKNGEYIDAKIVDKFTIVPVTIDSASRGNDISPHPLHDNLKYVAADYLEYANENEKNQEKTKAKHKKYKENLYDWTQSSFTCPIAEAVYQYISKGKLIRNLIDEKILITDEDGKLIEKWADKTETKPDIFNHCTSQFDCFIRFCVLTDNGYVYPWKDKETQDAVIAYQKSLIDDVGLCYISGKVDKLLHKHPINIIRNGDRAKLISSPSDDGYYTYKGTFQNPDEAFQVSMTVSYQAHNALAWLIQKQGFKVGTTTYVVFGTGNYEDSDTEKEIGDLLLSGLDNLIIDEDIEPQEMNTEEILAKKLEKALNGYRTNFHQVNDKVVIISLDETSEGQGRISMTTYYEFEAEQYFELIKEWQKTTAWPAYNPTTKQHYFYTPSLREIAYLTYGQHIKEKVYQKTVIRLLPCILQKRPIPKDILSNLLLHTIKIGKKGETDRRKTLKAACSLLRHNAFVQHKGGIQMKLDKQNKDRSYLFGRLLAVADYTEESILKSMDIKRDTNAQRLMQMMYFRPAITWSNINKKVNPYLQKKACSDWLKTNYKQMTIEIIAELGTDGFTNRPLKETFLVGYSTQMEYFYLTKEEKKEIDSPINHEEVTL